MRAEGRWLEAAAPWPRRAWTTGRAVATLVALTGLALLGGCASLRAAEVAQARRSPTARILDVPFEPQGEATDCGVAAADMVTRYYGAPLAGAPRERLASEARTRGAVSGRALKASLQEAGYFAALFAGSLDREVTGLYRQLDLGRPLIVMVRPSPAAPGHYVVLAGQDAARGVLVILDPLVGPRVVETARFLKAWEGAGRFTLLAAPPARQEPPAAGAVTNTDRQGGGTR